MTRPRHRAREAALQVLYLCEVGGATPAEALETYFATHQPEMAEPQRQFATTLVMGAADEHELLDALIQAHSRHWRLERLAILDRLILRIAAWELRHEPDVPPAVVLDEAIELARTFSADDSVRFVNGVLEGIRRAIAEEREDNPVATGTVRRGEGEGE
jgi:N utilization substance protein B